MGHWLGLRTTVLVTEAGNDVLSDRAPKEVSIIEELII